MSSKREHQAFGSHKILLGAWIAKYLRNGVLGIVLWSCTATWLQAYLTCNHNRREPAILTTSSAAFKISLPYPLLWCCSKTAMLHKYAQSCNTGLYLMRGNLEKSHIKSHKINASSAATVCQSRVDGEIKALLNWILGIKAKCEHSETYLGWIDSECGLSGWRGKG